MICKNCGTEANNGETFCPVCGAKLADETTGKVENPASISPTAVMVWGIVAASLGASGLIGLIISIIARKKSKQYLNEGGIICGQSKVGSILSKVGLGLSIGFMIFWTIYIIAIIAAFAIGGFATTQVVDSYSSFIY